MAVRLRIVDGKLVALCAAQHKKLPGDRYIDDAEDHALRVKYLADYRSEGWVNPGERIMELSAEQISFMRGEIPASGPQVWMGLLEAGLVRISNPSGDGPARVTGYREYSGGHLFCLTPEGAEAIRSRMVSAEITGITSSKEQPNGTV